MSQFTSSHHTKIARAIKAAKAKHAGNIEPLASLQGELAQMFGQDNSEFSPDVFDTDCAPEPVRTRETA